MVEKKERNESRFKFSKTKTLTVGSLNRIKKVNAGSKKSQPIEDDGLTIKEKNVNDIEYLCADFDINIDLLESELKPFIK